VNSFCPALFSSTSWSLASISATRLSSFFFAPLTVSSISSVRSERTVP
jgi:hypothetical protein